MRLALAVVLLLVALPLRAETPLPLTGSFAQGGLLFGQVAPGSQVRLDGNPLSVSPQGRFLLAFDRDAAPVAEIQIVQPDGSGWHRVVSVAPRSYRVQRIDGLPQDKVVPPEAVWDRILAEKALLEALRAVDRPASDYVGGFVWPAKGRISGVYGSQRILNGEPRQPHYGIDIAVPRGTPVLAPADGVVALTHPGLYFAGMTLVIDHGQGLKSSLLHLSDILVGEGEVVRKGQPVAKVGASGRVTGAHLDWRVSWFDRWIDPAQLVGAQ
ncbi:MAG: M23 family metallopeptidase [Rhodospirillales bacterium]